MSFKIEALLSIAREAGHCLMTHFKSVGGDLVVMQKSDNSPVTIADKEASELIVNQLSALSDSIPVLSEESSEILPAERLPWQRYWLVDPLDGTKEFLHQSKEFTVNIALIELGQPVMGIVYAPALGKMYYASQSKGAYLLEGESAPVKLETRLPKSPIKILGSLRHQSAKMQKYLECLDEKYVLKKVGSSLKFCWLAEGLADIYPRFVPTSEWDTAAAHCILNEAGGKIVTNGGSTLQYNQKDSLINPNFIALGHSLAEKWISFPE